ncbi:MAG: BON domain-containing protein [Pseudomonadota bacterium]
MNKTQVLVLGAILLAILGYFCISNHALIIQNDIHTRVQQTLDLEETQQITVTTQGRDITLSGEVENETIKQQAELNTFRVEGVRLVINKLKLASDESITESSTIHEPEISPNVEPTKEVIQTPNAEGI